jgi:spore coat polysaccharide biosynthesis protein SpsF (cytidylyltransferase family)
LSPQPRWRWHGRDFTVDTRQDYEWATSLTAAMGRIDFSLSELLDAARYVQ